MKTLYLEAWDNKEDAAKRIIELLKKDNKDISISFNCVGRSKHQMLAKTLARHLENLTTKNLIITIADNYEFIIRTDEN